MNELQTEVICQYINPKCIIAKLSLESGHKLITK